MKFATPAPAGTRLNFRTWIAAAALALATMALYWPVTLNDFINYDDPDYVTHNSHVQQGLSWTAVKWAFTSEVNSNWHPLTMLSHMLDCQLYGLHPWGHHLTSLLWHALNTGLLFLLLQRLTGMFWRSVAVAALFGCHPLRVESVAWVSERKDVLSVCFGLLALLLYVRYARGAGGNQAAAGKENEILRAFHRSTYYWLAWLCLGIGLMCKSTLVTWPFVFLLLDYWPLQRLTAGRVRSLLAEKLPFLALVAAASTVTFLVQKQTGAVRELTHLTLGMRCENAVVSYCRYAFKFLWPVNLTIFYPHPGYWPPMQVAVAGAVLLGLSVFIWRARRDHPFALMGWLWFLGTLVPVIGLVQVGGQAMADRYSYIPSVGLLIVVIWGACEWSRNWPQRGVILSLAGLAAVVAYSAVTRQQLGYWRDSETLFRHALEVAPDNGVARNCYGLALLDDHQTNAAVSQFERAIELNPDFYLGHNNLGMAWAAEGKTMDAIAELKESLSLKGDNADAHGNVAILLGEIGHTNEAIREFEEAIRLRPDFADTHFDYANLLQKDGDIRTAISQYQDTIRLNPSDVEAHYWLGNLLAKMGETDQAITQYQEAIRLKPDYFEARNNLGSLLNAQSRVDDAIQQFQEAIRLKPDDVEANYNLGNEYLKQDRMDDAIRQYQTVAKLSPDFAPARYYLGVALARKGITAEAISQIQEAIRLKPDYAVAHNKLGVLFGGQGRLDDAIHEFQEALRIKPDYAEASNNLMRVREIQAGRTGK